jgi:hypothetical protein
MGHGALHGSNGGRCHRQAEKYDSHQQAGFTAGTVADDDEFAADLSHGLNVTGLWRKERRIEWGFAKSSVRCRFI